MSELEPEPGSGGRDDEDPEDPPPLRTREFEPEFITGYL